MLLMPRRSRNRTTLASLLLVAALMPVIVALEAFWALTRPRLDPDPGFEVATTVGENFPGEPLVVHVLGDSTIAGVGVDRAEDSLGVRVAARASEQLARPIRVIGHGVSGATTDDVVEQLANVPIKGVDAIVIEVGSNDVTHRHRLHQVESDTREMLAFAIDRAPVVVFGSSGKLNTPNFHQPLRWIVTKRATAVRSRQAQVARGAGVRFVNIAREVAPAFERIGDDVNSSDRFHPSALGYDIWSKPLAHELVAGVRQRSEAAASSDASAPHADASPRRGDP